MAGSITATVVISAITSAIVSVVAFVVGVRISKDQGDRTTLRAIYQRLFEHFHDLREAIGDGRPKAWPDFPLREDEFVPPFRTMQLTGEANLLPPTLAARCECAESAALIAGGRMRKWVSDTYVPQLASLINILAPASKKSILQRTYRDVRPIQLSLMPDAELQKLAEAIRTDRLGVGLELSMERGHSNRLYVYPEYVAGGDSAALITQLWRLAQDDESATKLRADLAAAATELDQLIRVLSARIRDPHPLFESIRLSLSDALRGH
jgi:hypothetical protein